MDAAAPEGAVGFVRRDGERDAFLRRGCALTLGRHPAAAMPIKEVYASRQHIVLISRQDSVWIVDTSSNGTLLRVDDLPEVKLKHEGVIVRGDFKFLVAADPATKPADDPSSSSSNVFQFTSLLAQGEASAESGNALEAVLPLSSLPPEVKDAVEHLPTQIDRKALKLNPGKVPSTEPRAEAGQWRQTHSQDQAFTIFDMFSKKPLLPFEIRGEPRASAPVITMKKRRVHAPKAAAPAKSPRKKARRSSKSKIISSQEFDF